MTASPTPPWPCRSRSPVITSRASAALAARSRPRRTRSIPSNGRGSRAGVVDGVDHLVADGDAVLVDAVLGTPQPRPGRDRMVAPRQRRATRHCAVAEDRARRPPIVNLDQLRFAHRAIRVLGEEGAPVAQDAHGVAHDSRSPCRSIGPRRGPRSGRALVGLPPGQVREPGVVRRRSQRSVPAGSSAFGSVPRRGSRSTGREWPPRPNHRQARAVRPERCRYALWSSGGS